MYRLYYSPRAASFLPHVALEEIGQPFELIDSWNDLHSDRYAKINPMRRVPALETPDGILTEGHAIVTYLAIRHSDAKLLPPENQPIARARAHEIMNLLASAHLIAVQMILHPDWFASDPSAFEAIKAGGLLRLRKHFDALEQMVEGRTFTTGPAYCIADANMMMNYRYGLRCGLPMRDYPNLTRIAMATLERPAVKRAMTTEGITME